MIITKKMFTWVYINVLEEVLIHVVVIALWMVARDTDILIHVECFHIFEGKLSILVKFYQLLVHTKGSATYTSAHSSTCINILFSTSTLLKHQTRHRLTVFLQFSSHTFFLLNAIDIGMHHIQTQQTRVHINGKK